MIINKYILQFIFLWISITAYVQLIFGKHCIFHSKTS